MLMEELSRETTYKYAFNNLGDFTFGLTAGEQSIKTILKDTQFFTAH